MGDGDLRAALRVAHRLGLWPGLRPPLDDLPTGDVEQVLEVLWRVVPVVELDPVVPGEYVLVRDARDQPLGRIRRDQRFLTDTELLADAARRDLGRSSPEMASVSGAVKSAYSSYLAGAIWRLRR